MGTSMSVRIIAILLLGTLATGCGWLHHGDRSDSSDGSQAGEDSDPSTWGDATRIRKAFATRFGEGMALSPHALPEGRFVELQTIETALINPLRPTYCHGEKAPPAFAELSQTLGGIRWGYGVSYYDNYRTPILFGGIAPNVAVASARDDAHSSSKAEKKVGADTNLPEIARADLIGRFEDKVIFLSKRYGLFFVHVPATGNPTLSCSVLVPGEPKNFYVYQDRLYLLTNGANASHPAALIRYDLWDKGIEFSGYHLFEGQRILDSRRFDGKLAVLGRNQPKPKSVQRSPKSTTSMTVEVADDDIGMGVSLREPAINILTVLDLDDASMSVVFEEIFLPQENVMKLSSLAKADASLIARRWRRSPSSTTS